LHPYRDVLILTVILFWSAPPTASSAPSSPLPSIANKPQSRPGTSTGLSQSLKKASGAGAAGQDSVDQGEFDAIRVSRPSTAFNLFASPAFFRTGAAKKAFGDPQGFITSLGEKFTDLASVSARKWVHFFPPKLNDFILSRRFSCWNRLPKRSSWSTYPLLLMTKKLLQLLLLWPTQQQQQQAWAKSCWTLCLWKRSKSEQFFNSRSVLAHMHQIKKGAKSHHRLPLLLPPLTSSAAPQELGCLHEKRTN
jgi:hypothetical protein